MRYICENDHIFEAYGKMMYDKNNVGYEIPVCPICETKIFSEYVLGKKRITSLISVDISEVDTKIKEGYEVENTYAKTATLVKRE